MKGGAYEADSGTDGRRGDAHEGVTRVGLGILPVGADARGCTRRDCVHVENWHTVKYAELIGETF